MPQCDYESIDTKNLYNCSYVAEEHRNKYQNTIQEMRKRFLHLYITLIKDVRSGEAVEALPHLSKKAKQQ